ncbi:hypothetical protein DTO282E5_7752 [Paecilomyces variotii]|nr:hypothetical protein DTO282E5_7752 [Paecilomyces variotii]
MRIPGEDESPRIAEEINAVIRYRVRKFQQKRGLEEGTANYLEKRLMEIKHRTYLWLYLVFDYLENELLQNGRLEKPASAIAISSYFGLEVVVRQLLIKNGIDDGYISDFDKSSLLWAAERGHEAVVKLLLQTGKADLNLKDPEFGKTPIAYTAENGHKAIAEPLLGTGQVDPDSISKEGRRLLAYAFKNGHEAIVKLLLETGRVDPESVTEDT